jgi:predicted glycosyltransferase
MDEPSSVREDWTQQGVYEALERLYDHVLVYGDRAIVDSTVEYALPAHLAQKVHFTGYLGRDYRPRSRESVRQALGLAQERLVVAHAGGGGDGGPLIESYLRCLDSLPRDVYSLVVTGPLMDSDERLRLSRLARGDRVRVVDYQEDLLSYVAAADLVVSMAGYNSVCEAVSLGVPTLVVPRVYPRTEQYLRAQRFAARGLLAILHPDHLNPDRLGQRVREVLDTPPRAARAIQLDGGARAAEFFTSLLSRGTNEPAEMGAQEVYG